MTPNPFVALRDQLRLKPRTQIERDSYYYLLLAVAGSWWEGLDPKPAYDVTRPAAEVCRLLRQFDNPSPAVGNLRSIVAEIEPPQPSLRWV
jgi:hypothetical protein